MGRPEDSSGVLRIGKPCFSLDDIRSQDTLSALVHKVGHEVGNPLTSIISLATVIERFSGTSSGAGKDPVSNVLDPGRIAAYAGSIINESWRISSTMEKVVLLLSQRAGSPEQYEVTKIVQNALNRLRTRQKADISLVRMKILGSEPPLALIDCDQFVALICELVDNAFLAMEYSGDSTVVSSSQVDEPVGAENAPEILIEAGSSGDLTTICVQSLSPCPCPYELSHVFEPMVTAYAEQKHIGLGLAAAYAIVTRAGGTIEIEEEALDGSYCFTVRIKLPRGKTKTQSLPEQKQPVSPLPSAPGGSLVGQDVALPSQVCIFIVEDELDVAKALGRVLELAFAPRTKFSFRIMSGQEAVSAIKSNTPFDLMLCDLNLSGMSGRYVYDSLVAERPKEAAKFVFLTGEKARPETQLYLQTSGRLYMHKPFAAEELVALVLKALSNR